MKKHTRLCGILALWATSPLVASEIERDYRSTRMVGQGDAGIVFSKSSDGLFYNPANLANTASKSGGLLNDLSVLSMQMAMSPDMKDLYNDQSAIKGFQTAPLDSARALEGKDFHLGVYGFHGAYLNKGMAFGLVETANVNFKLENDNVTFMPNTTIDAKIRAGLIYGWGFSLPIKGLMIGANAKLLQKKEIYLDLPGTRLLDVQATGQKFDITKEMSDRTGLGLGMDLGATYQWLDKGGVKPFVGLVVKNLGYMGYGFSVKGKQPHPDTQRINLGNGVAYSLGLNNFRVALDLVDLLNTTKSVLFKRLHLGSEWNLKEIFGITTGFSQGYTTYGAFLQWKIIRLAYASFGEEMGDQPGEKLSQRSMVQLQLGWIP